MESIQTGLGRGNGTSGSGADKTDKVEKKSAGGRKDHGHEGNPNAEELLKSLPRLKGLLEAKEAAGSAFGKAVKAAAKKCGFNADVVRAAVKAFSGEKEDLELQTRRAEQLSLAFEAIAGR